MQAAKAVLDRGGHGHGIALTVDDRQVAGGRQFRRTIGAGLGRPGRGAGHGGTHGLLQADALGPGLQVGGVQQPGHRHADKVRVGNVLGAVGVGQPVGLRDQVNRVDRVGFQAAHIKVIQDAQGLQHRNAAGAGGRHAANAVTHAVHRTHRRTHLVRVIAQVVQAQAARAGGVGADFGHDVVGNFTGVKRLGATAGNGPERGRQRRIFQPGPGGFGAAIRLKKIAGARFTLRLNARRRTGNRHTQARRYGKTALGQGNGGGKQLSPRQLAVGLVRGFQHAQHTGGTYRQATIDRRHPVQRLAVRADKQIRRGRPRRGFTAIVGQHLGGALVKVQQEGPAANAGGLRLHQVQDHLHGNRRIHRAATLGQDTNARLHRQRMGGRHHVLLGVLNGLGGVTRGRLGRPVWFCRLGLQRRWQRAAKPGAGGQQGQCHATQAGDEERAFEMVRGHRATFSQRRGTRPGLHLHTARCPSQGPVSASHLPGLSARSAAWSAPECPPPRPATPRPES